jgi:hypothetical protein
MDKTSPMKSKPLVDVTCKLGTKGCFEDGRCHALGNCENKIATNADHIRAMSDEHLANYLMQFTDLDCRIGFCQNKPKCEALLETEDGIPLSMCEKCLLEWLRQPVEEKHGT